MLVLFSLSWVLMSFSACLLGMYIGIGKVLYYKYPVDWAKIYNSEVYISRVFTWKHTIHQLIAERRNNISYCINLLSNYS